MARPSPIHRDPEVDGSDYGCLGPRKKRGNNAIARMVEQTEAYLHAGDFAEGGDLIDYVKDCLEEIDRTYSCGCCDTVVQENAFAALTTAIAEVKLPDFNRMEIYGW